MPLDIPPGRIEFPLNARERAMEAAERGEPCFDPTREPPEVVVPVSRAWIATTAPRPEEPAEARW